MLMRTWRQLEEKAYLGALARFDVGHASLIMLDDLIHMVHYLASRAAGVSNARSEPSKLWLLV